MKKLIGFKAYEEKVFGSKGSDPFDCFFKPNPHITHPHTNLGEAFSRRIDLDGDKVAGQEILLEELRARIRDVRAGPNGFLYVLTDARDGKLIRIEPR